MKIHTIFHRTKYGQIVCVLISSFVSAVTGGISEQQVWTDLNDERNSLPYQLGISL